MGKYLFHFLEDGLQYQLLGELNHHYASVIVWLIISYVFTFLIYFAFISRKLIFLGIYALVTIVMLCLGNIQSIALWLLLLFASIPCLLLIKLLNTKIWGRQAIGNLLLLGVIIFATWKIFVPDSDVTTLKNKSEIDVFGLYYRNFINIICFKYKTFRDSSMPFALGNPTAFVVSLGVFIYTAFLCSALKSWIRWILYIIAGIAVLVTGISYYQNFDPVVQIALFILFVIVFCANLSFIRNDKKLEYPTCSEKLGRTRTYNRLHAWIRRSLKHEEGKAMLLLGGWGTGKTHCIQYLSHRLSLKQSNNDGKLIARLKKIIGGYDKRQHDDNFDKDNAFMGETKICRVNLWEYSSREEAWNAIIQALGRTILGRYSLLNSFAFSKYLPSGIRSILRGNIIGCLYELFFWGDYNRNIDLCKRLSDDIGYDERIVLILDDIERANFQIINALPPLIEKLHKIERLMVICSLAKDELAIVHKKEINQQNTEEFALENLTGYLIKVFDYSFTLQDVSSIWAENFVGVTREENELYKQYPLTNHYIDESKLPFTTPRQIERTMQLLSGIEQQFFYVPIKEEFTMEDEIAYEVKKYDTLYGSYMYTVFLIEIIRTFYPQLLCAIQKEPRDAVQFAQKVEHMVELIERGKELSDTENKELEDFKKGYNYIYDNINSDRFYVGLIKALHSCKCENVRRAMEGEYKRRFILTNQECEEIYESNKNEGQINLKEIFQKKFNKEDFIFEDIEVCCQEFFEYILERVGDIGTDYAEFLKKLIPQGYYEKDGYDSQYDSFVFSWTDDHVLYLMYLYTERTPRNEAIKEVILEMFEKVSLQNKFFFLDNIDKVLPNNSKLQFHYYANSYEITSTKISGIMKEFNTCYVMCFIQDILNSKFTAEQVQVNCFQIYRLFCSVIDTDNIERIAIDQLQLEEAGISNLTDVVTSCSDEVKSCNASIMTASELKANLFLSILRKWFDSHSVSSVLSARIDRWIGKCEASISYWKDDKTRLNTLRNYTVGAERVKEFLEGLKAKKESPVEKEEGKISE